MLVQDPPEGSCALQLPRSIAFGSFTLASQTSVHISQATGQVNFASTILSSVKPTVSPNSSQVSPKKPPSTLEIKGQRGPYASYPGSTYELSSSHNATTVGESVGSPVGETVVAGPVGDTVGEAVGRSVGAI